MNFVRKFFAITFPVRLAWTSWIILLLAVTVRVMVTHHYSQTVVPIYLHAAHRWVDGENLYALSPNLDLYRNPPGFAAMFAAFTLFPGKVAGIIWRLLSAAVLLAGLYRFANCTELSSRQTCYFLSLVALLIVPSVNNGQVNVMLAGCILLGFASAMNERHWPATICLALSVGLKVYPVAAMLLAIVAVPRLGWRCAIALVVMLALPFAMQSPSYVLENYRNMIESVSHDDRSASAVVRAPQDWTIVPRVWCDVVITSSISKAVSVLAGIAFAVMVILTRSNSRLPIAFVLASIWMTLFGPATELPTYTILAPAAAWWAIATPSLAAKLAVALLLAPILRGMFPQPSTLPLRSAAPLGALLLLMRVTIEVLRHQSGFRLRAVLARVTSGAGGI